MILREIFRAVSRSPRFHVISRKLHQATAPDYKIFLFEIEIKYLIKRLINNSYYGRVLKHHECNFKYYSTNILL